MLTSPSFRTGGDGGTSIRSIEAMPSTRNPHRNTRSLHQPTERTQSSVAILSPLMHDACNQHRGREVLFATLQNMIHAEYSAVSCSEERHLFDPTPSPNSGFSLALPSSYGKQGATIWLSPRTQGCKALLLALLSANWSCQLREICRHVRSDTHLAEASKSVSETRRC